MGLNSHQATMLKEFGMYVSLSPIYSYDTHSWIDPVSRDASRLLKSTKAREYGVIPFQISDEKLYVACSDVNHDGISSLFLDCKLSIVLCSADPVDVMCAQDRAYGLPESLEDSRIGGILIANNKLSAENLLMALHMQPITGGKIGAVLASSNSVTHWDLAEALAIKMQIPAIDLLSGPLSGEELLRDSVIVHALDHMEEEFWFRHLVFPVAVDARTLTVAMVDPSDLSAVAQLEERFERKIRIMVTGYRDVMQCLNARYRPDHEELSRTFLLRNQPENSAYRQLTRRQQVSIIIGVIVLGSFVAWNWLWTFIVLSTLVQIFYSSNAVFRLWMMWRSSNSPREVFVSRAELNEITLASLPEYTVLVPVYKEANVLPILVQALLNLEYPKDRLDVKLLLEEDDEETIKVARESALPNFIELVIVPASEPRTKPKACNYGMYRARGEYTVIFDAEDIPEPDQLLKAVAVFRSSDSKLACVQAKLSYFNEKQNILTRWFTAEYAMWFDLFLPALFSMNMPIPLGGSSNHFRTAVLRDMGAWDPYNVTEDADLGVRLHKMGYRTTVMNSVTYEEANSEFVNWVRQRSRWVKGYMQTWLVHLRNPKVLHKKLGFIGSFGFHMMLGGTPFMFLVNPLLWTFVITWFIFGPNATAELLPSWVYYLAAVNFFAGNFMFIFTNVAGLAKREHWSLIPVALMSPVYWVFMSIGAWKGAIQLITRPSYWEKTVHGLAPSQYTGVTESTTN